MAALRDIRTAIIESDRAIRDSLVALVGGTRGYAVAGSFRSVDDARSDLDLHSPDVVLLGLGDGASPPDTVRGLKQRYPAVPILVVCDDTADEQVFATISAGASGLLLRETPPARMLEAIRELQEGGAPMSPRVARVVVGSFHRTAPHGATRPRLSKRELETLRLLAGGHSYKTAAAELGVSLDTVRFHVRNIYEKLQVHSKVEAVLKATRDGLVP